MMDYLDKLAKNPHIQLTPKQLEMLRERRRKRIVRHPTDIPKHPTAIQKHNPEVERQEDGSVS